ncbi:hypothetical protein QUB10_32175 [Microcoleus sp. B5-D4]|uniref:hypothetical protein n=1 Tax=unclassified Microcoleus TaxID=2642155 RepID=UPI002FD34418
MFIQIANLFSLSLHCLRSLSPRQCTSINISYSGQPLSVMTAEELSLPLAIAHAAN